jgi:guanylate kinase
MNTNHILISGPSASGKTTLIRNLLKNYKSLSFSVSHTTRPRREGEVDGKDYHFITVDDFLSLIKNGKILEYTIFNGNYYGTSYSELSSKIPKIFDVEYEGVLHFKTNFPYFKFIFIDCDKETIKERLTRRGDKEKDIEARLKLYDKFQEIKGEFDKVVMNNKSIEEGLKEIVEYLKLD